MVPPQTACRTLGVSDFIRVPSPAARMMTAAGPLTLTRRAPRLHFAVLLGCCPPVGSRSPVAPSWPALILPRSRGPSVHAPDPRRIPSGRLAERVGWDEGPAQRNPAGPARLAERVRPDLARPPDCRHRSLASNMDSIQSDSGRRGSTSSTERLRERAIALRRAGTPAGRSRRSSASAATPLWTAVCAVNRRRSGPAAPGPRTTSHARARELRDEGLDYEEIAGGVRRVQELRLTLGQGHAAPERLSYEECRKRSAEGVQRYWATERPTRERPGERRSVPLPLPRSAALTEREILIAGAIAYWCEGAKSKPHRRDDRWSSSTAIPALIRFFLRFLDSGRNRPARTCAYRVHIHETADVAAAERFWLSVTHADHASFAVRRSNVTTRGPSARTWATDYHGCLSIDVRRSADLYRQIEGWARHDHGQPDGARLARGVHAARYRTWLPARLPGEDSNLC